MVNYSGIIVAEKLENWSSCQNTGLPQLTNLLSTLFLKANRVWYKNKVQLGNMLKCMLKTYQQHPKKELQMALFTILGDIVMDHKLDILHRSVHNYKT